MEFNFGVLSVQLFVIMFHQLGIAAQTPAEFLAKAKEIVMRHKELQVQANMLQGTISHIEQEQSKVVSGKHQHQNIGSGPRFSYKIRYIVASDW